MGNRQQAQAEYDRAVYDLAVLYHQLKEHPQRFPAPYDTWVSTKLRLWRARERLRQAEQDSAPGG